MSYSNSRKDQRHLELQSNAQMNQGRKIINVGPIDSKLVSNRSAGPGDVPFNQHFGQQPMGDTFARGTVIHDSQDLRRPRAAHFDQATPTGTSLLGGVGRSRDTQGDAFHNLADAAQRQKQSLIRQSNDPDATPASRLRTNNSQMSHHQSMDHSGELIGPLGGRGYHGAGSANQTQNMHVEESNGPSQIIQGLTKFLRNEYYRKNGVYLSGNLDRDEHIKLFDFWRVNISEECRREKEQEKQQKRMSNTLQKKEDMLKLSMENPNLYRRYQVEQEAKQQAKDEQMERDLKIASRITTRCRYHTGRPVQNCKTCQRGSQQSSDNTQRRPGSAVVARKSGSAVPEVKPSHLIEYERFKNCRQKDVAYTVEQDLQEIQNEEKKAQREYEEAQMKRMEQQDSKTIAQITDDMLQIYFLSNPVFADPNEQAKNDSPSKQAAQPAGAVGASNKRPQTAKNIGGRPPLKPTVALEAPNQSHLKNMSIKEMMSSKNKAAKPQLKDSYDLEKHVKEPFYKYQFFSKLFAMVRQSESKVMPNDSAIVQKVYKEKKADFITAKSSQPGLAPSDKDESQQFFQFHSQWIQDFFQPKEFVKRLQLHQQFCCLSKTKQAQSLKLYYAEMQPRDRAVSLIDFVPPQNQQDSRNKRQPSQKQFRSPADIAIQEVQDEIEEQKQKRREDKLKKKELEEEQKARDKDARNAPMSKHDQLLKEKEEKKAKEAERQERFKKLAVPKDKWVVGKKLKELQQQFPHDRVLERMIKQEFKENQTFRYPDEYDQFDQEEEKLMKGQHGLYNNGKGTSKDLPFEGQHDGAYLQKDYGQGNLATQNARASKAGNKKQQWNKFQEDLIEEAKTYAIAASGRLEGNERKTVRKSLADIYSSFKVKHAEVINEYYKLKTAAYSEEELKRYEDNKVPVDLDAPPLLDANKQYPEKFKRYFMRLIKSMAGHNKGKIQQMDSHDVKQKAKRLPTTFMVAGTSKRCTIHEFSCPEHPCKYRTHNKKIIKTGRYMEKNVQKTQATKTRVFYSDTLDKKKDIPSIFMTNDEQLNCRFEPMTGSLNPHYDNGQLPPECRVTCDTDAAWCEKLGPDLQKLHPEIFKKGKLQRAKRKYAAGKPDEAMNELMAGFKLISLRREFDPDFHKRQEAIKIKAEEQKRVDDAKAARDKKAIAMGGLPKKRVADEDDDFKNLTLANMEESPEEKQKDMPSEQFDKKQKPKLYVVLEEAYHLLMKIENDQLQKKKTVRNLERQKMALQKKRNTLQSINSSIENDGDIQKVHFKTIMCPLIETCQNDTRDRWPKSSLKTTTQLGYKCPYAHHPMELVFPQTIKTKISAIDKMVAVLTDSKKGKDGGDKKPQTFFKPSGKISDCQGGCFAKTKCNMCIYKVNAGIVLTHLDPVEEVALAKENYIAEKKENRKLYDNMLSVEPKETREYIERIKELKEELQVEFEQMYRANDKVRIDGCPSSVERMDDDAMYCMKFGLLKKASVLAFYYRDKDAKYEISKAAQIVKKQREIQAERQKAIERRWQVKIGLDDGFELPEKANIKKRHPKDISDEDLMGDGLESGITLASIRLYIEKVSPFNHAAYGKNVFLDKCIEDLYMQFEAKKNTNRGHIEHMKKHIEKLEEFAEYAADFGEEGVDQDMLMDGDDMIGDEEVGAECTAKYNHTNACNNRRANQKIKTTRKTKMCKDMLTTGKCKNGKDCKGAHNSIQLELVPIQKKIQNLKDVEKSQSRQLNMNTTIAAWQPPRKHIEYDKSCFEPYIDTKVDQNDNEEGDDKPKNIFEREDVFKDPHDEKD